MLLLREHEHFFQKCLKMVFLPPPQILLGFNDFLNYGIELNSYGALSWMHKSMWIDGFYEGLYSFYDSNGVLFSSGLSTVLAGSLKAN